MSETFLPLRRGGWINARVVWRIVETKEGLDAWDKTGEHYELAHRAEDNIRPSVFVAGQTAHVFIECDTEGVWGYQTTVIAWRIRPDHAEWPTPILLDTTDVEGAGTMGLPMIVIEDRGKFEEIGSRTYDNLDAVRAEALKRVHEDKAMKLKGDRDVRN